ncbi:cysteine--tRNA ligase [Candidatus Parcubacteria bacterium]|nr:cysteine--tRNA ligase [Candidatus Parcubacteria bacterium]
MKLYNTLTRKKEEFKSIKNKEVGLYTCGPTVYNYAHLGNLRTYIFEDILKRVLEYNNYKVCHVMNITDVGHLTSDEDEGEDKMEKGASREGKTAQEIAEFFTDAFKLDMKYLNIKEPTIWAKVTDNIPEQIDLIKVLEEKGVTYKISDGIYFDTSKFSDYNKLSHLDLNSLKEGARVEKNIEKRNATDFALWKFSEVPGERQQEWESPWGIGFPGWAIECSAICLKYLKNQDIHCGGIDHINVHHTNEIAQSETATGKKFFNYWMHGDFLNITGGKKMAKSDDNFLTLENALIRKNINPLVYRFAALQTHYRKPMEYSGESIRNAENGLMNLANKVRNLKYKVDNLKNYKISDEYKKIFLSTVNDDLNIPQALAVVQEVLKSDLSKGDKLVTILDFDKVLGLNLDEQKDKKLPKDIIALIAKRKIARNEKDWSLADKLRDEIQEKGYIVEDGEKMVVYKS